MLNLFMSVNPTNPLIHFTMPPKKNIKKERKQEGINKHIYNTFKVQ